MKNHNLSKTIQIVSALVIFAFSISCNPPAADNKDSMADAADSTAAPVNANYEIASSEYSDLAKKAAGHLSKFEWDAWGAMLADDCEYYFPDGDEITRTKLTGKQAILDWWKNWQQTSGIQSMTFSLENYLPFNALKAPNMTGMTGNYVISYFTNKMVYKEGEVSVRMNMSIHINDNKLIDRYYSYYDRTPIIQAMKGVNILEKQASK